MSDDRRAAGAGRVAAAAKRAAQTSPGTPNGASRSQPFPAHIRSQTVIVNGQERVKLVGCASVTEKRYRMWDMFGEYDEVVDQNAFAGTLSRKPDVAYLVNHRGMTMARTLNDTLALLADSKGLQTEAFVNPKRSDVADLVTAIEDRDITEMSFAFQILDGEWNDDYTEFRILEVELDRGDVSAVNYGANPYTDVAARQTELMQDLRKLPEGAMRQVVAELTQSLDAASVERADIRSDAPEDAEQRSEPDDPAPEPTTRTPEEALAAIDGTGRSVDLVRRRFELLTR